MGSLQSSTELFTEVRRKTRTNNERENPESEVDEDPQPDEPKPGMHERHHNQVACLKSYYKEHVARRGEPMNTYRGLVSDEQNERRKNCTN